MAWLADQVCGVLPLAGTLGGCGIVLSKFVRPLAAENGVPVHTGQGIGYIILDADAVAAIAGLPVNGIAARGRLLPPVPARAERVGHTG